MWERILLAVFALLILAGVSSAGPARAHDDPPGAPPAGKHHDDGAEKDPPDPLAFGPVKLGLDSLVRPEAATNFSLGSFSFTAAAFKHEFGTWKWFGVAFVYQMILTFPWTATTSAPTVQLLRHVDPTPRGEDVEAARPHIVAGRIDHGKSGEVANHAAWSVALIIYQGGTILGIGG